MKPAAGNAALLRATYILSSIVVHCVQFHQILRCLLWVYGGKAQRQAERRHRERSHASNAMAKPAFRMYVCICVAITVRYVQKPDCLLLLVCFCFACCLLCN